MSSGAAPARVVGPDGLDSLLETLRDEGWTVVGPTVRDQVIVYDEIRSGADLPRGWGDEQEAGRYRLRRRSDEALFGYAVGPHSWKKYLQVPRLRLWRAERRGEGFEIETDSSPPPRLAFLGVRACELRAIAVQDRILQGGRHADPDYASRRSSVLIVAVNCAEAASTCFCASMDAGPRVRDAFDLAITELREENGRHDLLFEAGSVAGERFLAALPGREATEDDHERGRRQSDEVARSQVRHVDTKGIRDMLYANLEHPRWDDVAARCLSCTNCTMVCPTCFCTTVEDTTDLSGETAERVRLQDSCFSLDHSRLHGGSVRGTTRARYRQWLVHKFGSWIDQFGTSGCVGCGRCITWCPVAIDVTEELAALREPPAGGKGRGS